MDNTDTNLKDTLTLDLCQGILEMPSHDGMIDLDYHTVIVAYEELHDLATNLANAVIEEKGVRS